MKESLRYITLLATIAGLPAGCAEVSQSKRADQKEAQVYRLSAEELNKPTLHEFIADSRQKTDEAVAQKAPETSPIKNLFEAVKKSDIKTLQILIEKGADVNVKDEKGMTPLAIAVWLAHKEVAHFLLENGADVNVVDKEGWPILIRAIRACHASLIRALIEKGADVNAPIKVTKENEIYILATPLMYASRGGALEIVRLLIFMGADINAVNDRGENALMCAALSGHVVIVKLLLKNGADPNIKTEDGETALSVAREKGYTDVAELLEQAESSQP